MTKNGVATLDDLFDSCGKTGQVCDFDISDAILPSDAECLTLTLHIMETLKYLGIFGAHSPCLCYQSSAVIIIAIQHARLCFYGPPHGEYKKRKI